MVASSEQHNAPVIVSKPASAHASSSQPGAPLSRDDSAEVIKIPDPIIEPITIMVASTSPSVRTRLDGGWRLALSFMQWLLLTPTLLRRQIQIAVQTNENSRAFNAGSCNEPIVRVSIGTTEISARISFVLARLMNANEPNPSAEALG